MWLIPVECVQNGRLYFMLVLLIRTFRSKHWLLLLVFKGRPRKEVVSPCGGLPAGDVAEVIRRYGRDFDVLMIGEEETVVIKASSLLPFSFEYTG